MMKTLAMTPHWRLNLTEGIVILALSLLLVGAYLAALAAARGAIGDALDDAVMTTRGSTVSALELPPPGRA